MKFEYNTGGTDTVWNPGTREYDSITAAPGWNPNGFLSGNNQITAWNHSNGDVPVSFNVTQNNLPGVDFEINTANALGAAAAVVRQDVFQSQNRCEHIVVPNIILFVQLWGLDEFIVV